MTINLNHRVSVFEKTMKTKLSIILRVCLDANICYHVLICFFLRMEYSLPILLYGKKISSQLLGLGFSSTAWQLKQISSIIASG